MEVDQRIVAFIIVIIVIAIVFILVSAGSTPTDMGEWQEERLECTSDDSCKTGTRLVIRRCIPNGTKGCLDDSGRQTFKREVFQEPCKPSCVRSVWREISRTSCMPAGGLGKREITVRCSTKDLVGTNACTNMDLVDVTGPNGETSKQKRLTIYQLGNEITYEEFCDDFENEQYI